MKTITRSTTWCCPICDHIAPSQDALRQHKVRRKHVGPKSSVEWQNYALPLQDEDGMTRGDILRARGAA